MPPEQTVQPDIKRVGMSELETSKLRAAVTYLPSTAQFYDGNARQAELQARSGQMVTSSEIETIEAKVVLQEVLGISRPAYVLRGICRSVNMNQLVLSIDIATLYTGLEKVGELIEADIVSQAYTRTAFDLWKNVVHIVLSDEARMRAAHDILTLQVNDASAELTRMENSQIKAEAEKATETSGHDWGDSSNNPYEDIGVAMEAIEAKYPVDFIAGHPRMWLDFFSNNFVKGTYQPVVSPQGTSFPIPGLPGVSGFSDRSLTNTIALVGSTRAPALVLGLGPVESARYRNEISGYDAFVIRQWLQPQLLIANAIRKVTGVHA